jgi:two-component system response regulator DctR
MARARSIPVTTYDCCERFFAEITNARMYDPRGECLLLDTRTQIMAGFAFYYELSLRDVLQHFPIIFLSNPDDIHIGVNMLKRIAFDLFTKPIDQVKLMNRVEEALEASQIEAAKAKLRITPLTAREKEVLNLIVSGEMNKVIGEKLGISRRTVEIHRANIFHKMKVKNAVELARIFK